MNPRLVSTLSCGSVLFAMLLYRRESARGRLPSAAGYDCADLPSRPSGSSTFLQTKAARGRKESM